MNKHWKNNKIQFPRLIAELRAVGAFNDKVMEDLSKEMGLELAKIDEIIDRAQKEWAKINPRI